MSKGINVKVKREKIIEALMSKLDDMEYAQHQYNSAKEKYDEDTKKWKDTVAQIAIAHMDITANIGDNTSITSHWYDGESSRIEVSVTVPNSKLPEEPSSPDNPFQTSGYGRNYVGNYDDRKADILNAIRILQLSDEDVVSTATYASVAKYL